MNWLDDLMEATSYVETPRSFIRWAAISAVSAVVKDNVYLDKFAYKLYPNIYVLLVAKSGLRKGFAANVAKALAVLVGNTRVISGRNSIQAIIQELSRSFTRPKQPPLLKAHGFIVSGELSTTFIEDPHTFTILTDLFDRHYHADGGGWKYTLKGQDQQVLKDPCITMLGAINPPLLKSMISKRDISGGFVARTIIVEEHKRALKNPLTRPPKLVFDIYKFVPRLKEIAELTGEFHWSPEAMEIYEPWYDSLDMEGDEGETGTINRIADHVTKVAMILSMIRDNKLIIQKEDLEQSMDLLNAAVRTAEGLTKGGGSVDNFAPKVKIVLGELINAEGGKCFRSRLLRKYWTEFNHLELDVIISTLERSNCVVITKKGRDEMYNATPTLHKEYEFLKKDN